MQADVMAFKAHAPGLGLARLTEQREEVLIRIAATGGVFFLNAEDVVEAHDVDGLRIAALAQGRTQQGVHQMTLGSRHLGDGEAQPAALGGGEEVLGGNVVPEREFRVIGLRQFDDRFGLLLVGERVQKMGGRLGHRFTGGIAGVGDQSDGRESGREADLENSFAHCAR